MSQVFSEINKVVNVVIPASQTSTTGDTVTSDIVNMANYKALTFIVQTGASVANTPTITVYGGETSTGATTAIAYKYRTQVKAGDATSASGDIPSALTDATSAGFAMTTAKTGGAYIIEVDPSTVAAADATDQTYDHVKIVLTNDGSTAAAQVTGVLAILSEPRYPQAILQTAID